MLLKIVIKSNATYLHDILKENSLGKWEYSELNNIGLNIYTIQKNIKGKNHMIRLFLMDKENPYYEFLEENFSNGAIATLDEPDKDKVLKIIDEVTTIYTFLKKINPYAPDKAKKTLNTLTKLLKDALPKNNY